MNVLELEEGWETIQTGITKLIDILEGPDESTPQAEVNLISALYNTVYAMVTQKDPHNYSEELYERYEGVYVDYLKSKVLPSVQEKHGVSMLQEPVKRWATYKVMVRKLCTCFLYLDRYYIPRKSLPSLSDVGLSCFRKEIMKVGVKDSVIALINHEREGGEIDQALLKNVLQVYVDLKSYVNDFETAFLNDTADYYTQIASSWSKEDYAAKAEECLRKEKGRVTHYLESSSEEKLLKRVQDVLNAAA
ncbi:hypothetical protein MKW94_020783 [Papaver nudicaule]|uniref:Cullin N-terminal domain-containing protein n=1 Tax=Papaver nudicaule TaxID=74823 RepID=A0AA42B1I7_PAPNU|nr:hypothetical protein [Papaver nudicaule]